MREALEVGQTTPPVSSGRRSASIGIALLALELPFLGGLVLARHDRLPVPLTGAIIASIVALAILMLLLGERRRLDLSLDNRRLRALVTTDPLTGLGNRRSFDEALERAWRDASRREATLSLILADADHFKAFNDAYGHGEGDRALRGVAKALAAAVRRPSDGAFRIGGEEFAVLLPDTDAAGAAMVAATIRAGIAALPTRHPDGVGGRFTVSMGIAQAAPSRAEQDRQVLFTAADRALYRAKGDGRDRIRVTAVIGTKRATDPAADASVGGLEILLPGGRSLTISDTISIATLQSVLGVLKEG